jgi:hypothetical protein
MERLTNLVGRGSRVTHDLSEEIRYGTGARYVRLQHAPSRGPACDQAIRWLRVSPVVTALVPNLMAHPRLHSSAALRPSDSTGGKRATARRNSLGLFGALPHQWPAMCGILRSANSYSH